MPIARRIVEKPGGARFVREWNLDSKRSLPVTGNPLHVPEFCLELTMQFGSDEAMTEFEAVLRSLLPEAAP